jgi:hypothetical protein
MKKILAFIVGSIVGAVGLLFTLANQKKQIVNKKVHQKRESSPHKRVNPLSCFVFR